MLWETYLSWVLCPVGAGCWVRGRIYNQLVRMNHRAPHDSRNRGTSGRGGGPEDHAGFFELGSRW